MVYFMCMCGYSTEVCTGGRIKRDAGTGVLDGVRVEWLCRVCRLDRTWLHLCFLYFGDMLGIPLEDSG